MNEPSEVTKVARDLTEIVNLCENLEDQAEHSANDRIMPGGLAMVALAGVANLEAWEHQYEAAERLGRDTSQVGDEDDTWEPPLQTLCFWSEAWRTEHGAEYGNRPTIASEANFLRFLLDWAWENEPHFEDFAKDVRQARVRMENLLRAGERPERSRIVCPDCAGHIRLIVLRGEAEDGSDDRWKCVGCKRRLDQDETRKAHAKMLRSEGAERWLHQIDAIGLLKAQERPERTVRQWLADGEGSAYCDPVTHEVWVWWPDLWRKHLSTPRRSRTGETVA